MTKSSIASAVRARNVRNEVAKYATDVRPGILTPPRVRLNCTPSIIKMKLGSVVK
jgi:hypothetical protein